MLNKALSCDIISHFQVAENNSWKYSKCEFSLLPHPLHRTASWAPFPRAHHRAVPSSEDPTNTDLCNCCSERLADCLARGHSGDCMCTDTIPMAPQWPRASQTHQWQRSHHRRSDQSELSSSLLSPAKLPAEPHPHTWSPKWQVCDRAL